MQYGVPQFIEMETKIVGPLTFKQFTFVGSGAAIDFILYLILGKKNAVLFVLLALPIAAFFLFLAFGKIKGRPFPTFLKNLFVYYLNSPKFFVFKKKSFGSNLFTETFVKPPPPPTSLDTPKKQQPKKEPSGDRLRNLLVRVETGQRE